MSSFYLNILAHLVIDLTPIAYSQEDDTFGPKSFQKKNPGKSLLFIYI